MITHHPIYRIWPGHIRSQRAFNSWQDFMLVDVPAVKPDDPDDLRSCERACSQAHANTLRRFLQTKARYCIVIEDDITLIDRSWLSLNDFDYFLPFAANRDETPGQDFTIRYGTLPQWGAQAYIASRRFAKKYISLLEAGGVADHINLLAGIGLRVGSFASNGVIHDNNAISMISEPRRLSALARTKRIKQSGDTVKILSKYVPA